MPIPVHAFAAHLQGEVEMRGIDHDGQSVVKALKGTPLKGNQYVRVPVRGGGTRRIANGNLDEIRPVWAMWAADKITTIVGNARCAIVPIPNKSAIVGTPATYRTHLLGQALLREMGEARAVLHDAFRWKVAMVPSHLGGPRGTGLYYESLEYSPAPYDLPYILIDDVKTLGASIRACARILSENGKNVVAAVCGAMTVYEQRLAVFNLAVENLPDFDPANPFGDLGDFDF